MTNCTFKGQNSRWFNVVNGSFEQVSEIHQEMNKSLSTQTKHQVIQVIVSYFSFQLSDCYMYPESSSCVPRHSIVPEDQQRIVCNLKAMQTPLVTLTTSFYNYISSYIKTQWKEHRHWLFSGYCWKRCYRIQQRGRLEYVLHCTLKSYDMLYSIKCYTDATWMILAYSYIEIFYFVSDFCLFGLLAIPVKIKTEIRMNVHFL